MRLSQNRRWMRHTKLSDVRGITYCYPENCPAFASLSFKDRKAVLKLDDRCDVCTARHSSNISCAETWSNRTRAEKYIRCTFSNGAESCSNHFFMCQERADSNDKLFTLNTKFNNCKINKKILFPDPGTRFVHLTTSVEIDHTPPLPYM